MKILFKILNKILETETYSVYQSGIVFKMHNYFNIIKPSIIIHIITILIQKSHLIITRDTENVCNKIQHIFTI